MAEVEKGPTHRLLRRDVYDNRLAVAGVFKGGKGAKRRRRSRARPKQKSFPGRHPSKARKWEVAGIWADLVRRPPIVTTAVATG